MISCIKKIKSCEDLQEIADLLHAKTSELDTRIMLCMGSGCIASGAEKVREAILNELERIDRKDVSVAEIVDTGCNGFCAAGPVLALLPDGYFYNNVTPEDAVKLVNEHIVAGKPVDSMMYESPEGEKIPKLDDIPFFSHQKLLVLRNRGRIAAEDIGDYIAHEGYQGAWKALTKMTCKEVVEVVKASGLRGRGGGGFSTGVKWEVTAASQGEQKYVICNADEGDPGAFMDRSILEGDPHAVIEGMLIAAKAIGATKGFVYCRAEYPLALARLNKAITAARDVGLLGKNIFDTGFDFDIEINRGSGAFVCGEETALLRSIEGSRGEPTSRPPFPAVSGLWDKPTLLNNVETFANIAQIILQGSQYYSSTGTENSKGTKVFALTGAINNIGLVEVEMGITLKEIIYDIGGGIPGGKKFKAAQIGGPSGGCIPEQYLDTPIDYESLNALGAIMGSGGLVVMDEDTCMVDVARFFLEFMQEESCGKCVPCRLGITRMLDIINGITQGHGRPGDIEELQQIGESIKAASLCGLGQTAPNPVLSTIRHFRDEYEAHIVDKRCPTGACRDLLTNSIDIEKCKGCGLCAKKCPTGAIVGTTKGPHYVFYEKCIACGTCLEVCRFGAVSVIDRAASGQ